MLSENRAERNQMEMFCIDSFVPEDHLLRKIDEALDFGKIYEIVGDLYCHNNGRPSVDPVVLFKIVFIQHLYGIPSLRRTCEEIKMNVAYRWFLGYLMNEQLPHFSTVSQNFKHRFTGIETVERVFADAKEKHGMRYTPYRGLAQVTKWVRLKFAALNLKKLAIHLRKDRQPSLFYTVYIPFLCSDLVFA